MGRYCSYLLPKQGRGTPKTKHDKISRTMGWETLYSIISFLQGPRAFSPRAKGLFSKGQFRRWRRLCKYELALYLSRLNNAFISHCVCAEQLIQVYNLIKVVDCSPVRTLFDGGVSRQPPSAAAAEFGSYSVEVRWECCVTNVLFLTDFTL